MARSLNKVLLIGNLTRDPELKYTPNGSAVCQFSVATNREWKDSQGQEKSETMFHRVVAWSKLAEIIPQFTMKGSKVFVEGRIVNRPWKDKAGVDHYITEIVANEVIVLDNKKRAQATDNETKPEVETPESEPTEEPVKEPKKKSKDDENVNPEDIPF
jgi:single-strand DNA-binding protein